MSPEDRREPVTTADFTVGDWLVQPSLNRIRRGADERTLPPQLIDLLAYLAARPGRVVGKDELFEHVWGRRFVAEATLTHALAELRRALGDDARAPRYVETVAKRGYRLVAPVHAPAPAARQRPPSPAVAVLPFRDLSPDGAQAALCDGIAEEIINSLGAVGGLHVTARTSSFALAARGLDVREIGERLGVDRVVEGGVLREGRRLRILVQVVEAATGTTVWSGRLERRGDDLFGLLDEAVLAVIRGLGGNAGAEAAGVLERRHGGDDVSWEHYLEGRFHWNRRLPGDLGTALAAFRRAAETDPAHPLALVGTADVHLVLGLYGLQPPVAAFSEARRTALAALARAPDLAEAHATLGMADACEKGQLLGGDASLARAIELAPSYAPARLWKGLLLASHGQFAAALFQIEAALALDPLSLIALAGRGWVLHQMGRLDEAIRWYRDVLAHDAAFAVAAFHCGRALAASGDPDEALRMLAVARGLGNGWAEGIEGYVHGRRGEVGTARKLLAALRDREARGWLSPAATALVRLGLGEEEAAAADFERALAARDPLLCIFLLRDPLLAAWWRSPRAAHVNARAALPIA